MVDSQYIERSWVTAANRPSGEIATPRSKFEHLPVPLPGEHQAINCGLALAILDTLKEKGYQINDQQALEGLAKTRLSGRMELICETGMLLVFAPDSFSDLAICSVR